MISKQRIMDFQKFKIVLNLIYQSNKNILVQKVNNMFLTSNQKRIRIISLLIFFSLFIVIAQSLQGQCSLNDEEFLVTFHPHLDAFWLNTDDELKNPNFVPEGFLYGMNQRNSKQIFNSMYDALFADPKRKFFITEVVFFKDWYEYISSSKKLQVKRMLLNGQIDLANSGWVENDEAVCYYDDILDQYTVGMNWMYEQFGYVNKIGWASDSFGHSHSQVALQHLLGFQFQGIERIDDRYIYERKNNPLLEFYWQPVSDSNGRKYGGLLNHIRHFLHQVNDLRSVPSFSITRDFQNIQSNMRKIYRKNKLFRFLGNDFQEFSPQEFAKLQQSFTFLNQESKPQCPTYKYGNPKDYLQIVKGYWSKNQVETRQNDFMPNWDQDRYWSGYYTTDPQLKIICKWYSRLINLVRKSMVKRFLTDKNLNPNNQIILTRAEQLLSIMQHHDGITATSKAHIQRLFKERMKNSSNELTQILRNVNQIQSQQECRFFENRNICNITLRLDRLTLSIVHEGIPKKERIQLRLPQNFIYTVEKKKSYVIQNPNDNSRYLVFETQLKPGRNDITLVHKSEQEYVKKIKKPHNKQYFYDTQKGVKISIKDGSTLRYQFGDYFFQFSYKSSSNGPSYRETVAWNKYGYKVNKFESVQPGIYIMSNNGQLDLVNPQFHPIQLVQFGNWNRVFIQSDTKIEIILTFKLDDPTSLQYDFKFAPTSVAMMDYFLMVQSNIMNEQSEFYHDSNGYLVAKRKIGSRPDYNWVYKKEDKINANTYPACSFFYQIKGEEKFLAFIDRALGVSTYDGRMLINIDRLAGDDYKGVGQGYYYQRQNHFNFKFAIVSKNDDQERRWQRSYDDSLVGYISSLLPVKNSLHVRKTQDKSIQYLKYTLSFLNKDEILLRIHNLAENIQIKLSKHGEQSWRIQEFGLNFNFTAIRQSFANGLVSKERYNWISDQEQINSMTKGASDQDGLIVLRPLQIRSFRINLNGEITDKQVLGQYSKNLSSDKMHKIQEMQKQFQHQGHSTKLARKSLRKRCF